VNIGIDATALPPQPVGAGNYIIQIIRALAELGEDASYTVFAQPHGRELIGLAEGNNLRFEMVSEMPPARRLTWEQTRLPSLLRRSRVDLLHSLHYTMPLRHPVKQVVTLHDMTYFLFPALHTFSKRYFFRAFIKLSGRQADALLADSESTRRDAIRLAGIPAGKITTALLGVTPEFTPIKNPEKLHRVAEKYQLPGRFILFVGLLEPRKNVITLLRAYQQNRPELEGRRLVIVGRKGWMYNQLQQIVGELNLGEDVHFTGYVEQADLPAVYNLADVFVYPSIYEGFGLPVLEAMACGTPVITTNVSSMPEITGEAGILVPAVDTAALGSALRSILSDPTLQQKISQEGLQRAAAFTWQHTARLTFDVYQRVLANK
jgi:glycosyltransferase involved in cell wall biosynthesis